MGNKTQWQGHSLALLAGTLLPLSFAPFHYYPIAIISLALWFSTLQNCSAKQAAVRGFLFGFGMFTVGVSWIYVAIHEFGHASILLASLLTFASMAFLALIPAAIAYGIKHISKEQLQTRDFILLLPLAWLLFEWFKTWFLTGFPWLELGVGQMDGPLAGFIPIIGVLGVSLLTAMTAGVVLVAVQSRQGLWLIPLAALWLTGGILKDTQWTEEAGTPLKVSLIQGNVPQAVKWEKEQVLRTLALYKKYTEQHWDSDIIVWPENAVTAYYHQIKTFYLDPLAAQARAHNTDILLGLPVYNQTTKQYFNSMMSLGESEGFYHKQHLVPFGDYLPLQTWLRGVIEFLDLPMSGFSAGDYQQDLLQVAGHQVGVSICYEDVFSNEIRRTLPQATILVNATNNAWYGDSFAPHQHLQISQSRALEMGRPVLRATTNGISALIDSTGHLQQISPQFEEAVITGMIQPRQGSTPYVAWGQWPLFVLSLFMLLIWAYYRQIISLKTRQ